MQQSQAGKHGQTIIYKDFQSHPLTPLSFLNTM